MNLSLLSRGNSWPSPRPCWKPASCRTSSSSTVHNTLVGLNLRDKIKLGASGKIVSAFDIARVLVIGADWANPAQMDARHLVQRMSATEIRLFSQQHAFL